MFLRGWVLAAQGQREAGMTQMRQAIAANRATRVELIWPYLWALAAQVYMQAGRQEAGWSAQADALALTDSHGERFWEAELHRLQGELVQHATRGTWHAALTPEECFGQALAVARRQQAKAWELRAAVSLTRLWQQQGKHAAAYELLAPVYGWFTEGFDTADLLEAKALLEALA
jgi:predicted ATPase